MPQQENSINWEKEPVNLKSIAYRMEYIEKHIATAKENNELLKDIAKAILGNQMSGDIGLVKKIENLTKEKNNIDDRLEKVESRLEHHSSYFKWVFGLVTATIIALITSIFRKFIG
jgi:hypothetical protein